MHVSLAQDGLSLLFIVVFTYAFILEN